jgi:hypothetical protein
MCPVICPRQARSRNRPNLAYLLGLIIRQSTSRNAPINQTLLACWAWLQGNLQAGIHQLTEPFLLVGLDRNSIYELESTNRPNVSCLLKLITRQSRSWNPPIDQNPSCLLGLNFTRQSRSWNPPIDQTLSNPFH